MTLLIAVFTPLRLEHALSLKFFCSQRRALVDSGEEMRLDVTILLTDCRKGTILPTLSIVPIIPASYDCSTQAARIPTAFPGGGH